MSKHKGQERGVTLIELLMAVAMVGIVSAIAHSGYAHFVEKSRVQKAITEIQMMQTEILKYSVEFNELPESLEDIGFGDKLDPWGNPYQYINLTEGAPTVTSSGPTPTPGTTSGGGSGAPTATNDQPNRQGLGGGGGRFKDPVPVAPGGTLKRFKGVASSSGSTGGGSTQTTSGSGSTVSASTQSAEGDEDASSEPRESDGERLNANFDLFSFGKDGASGSDLAAEESQDDIVRGNDGTYLGLASEY